MYSQEREKCGFIYTWAEYYLQPNQLDDVGHEQTIICRQLIESHRVGSWPLKGEKKNALSDN